MDPRLNKLYDVADAVNKTKGRIPSKLLQELRSALTDSKSLREPNSDDPDRDAQIIGIARNEWCNDELEIDECATVSEGGDNGAFVAAWVWVSFCDTELDKEKEEEPLHA